MIDVVRLGAFWGFLGAFSYAAPRFGFCLRDHPGGWRQCVLDAATAIFIGTCFVAALDPSITARLSKAHAEDLRALEFLIGLIANRVQTRLISTLADRLLDFFTGRTKVEP